MNNNESMRAVLHFERPAEICQFEWGYDDFRYYLQRVRELYAQYGRP
jgi:hypothetical protein